MGIFNSELLVYQSKRRLEISAWDFGSFLKVYNMKTIWFQWYVFLAKTICQPWINRPLGCLLEGVPSKYQIITIWRVPPQLNMVH